MVTLDRIRLTGLLQRAPPTRGSPFPKCRPPRKPSRSCKTHAVNGSHVELIRSQELSDKVPYAYAAIARGGSAVFTAGACPLDSDGQVVAVGDLAGQTERVMENLAAALRAAGVGLDSVLKTTVFVVTQKQSDLYAAWEVVRRHFGDHDAPSTLLGVTVLGYGDQLVEVEAVAAKG